jgi:uncharacterized membrane protein
MKKFTVGIFENRENAEKAINRAHNELSIPTDDLSFIYRNSEGEVKEVQAEDIASSTPAEGAGHGAAVGATIGALAGLATIAGVIPVIGPLFAAGPIAVALGLTGAVGTTAAAAATGAIAGGLIGALTHMGVGEENAKRYADMVQSGDVLVAAYAQEEIDVRSLFLDAGAIETEGYALAV